MRKLAILLVCLAAPAAWASIPDASGLIHGCMKPDGTLRAIDSAAHCALGETALNWSATGATSAYSGDGFGGEYAPTFTSWWSLLELRVLKLPAGSWVVSGSFSLHVESDPDGVNIGPDCALQARAGDGRETPLDHIYTNVDFLTYHGEEVTSEGGIGSSSFSVAFTLAATTDITLLCEGSAQPWAVRSPTFTAVRAASIVTQSIEALP